MIKRFFGALGRFLAAVRSVLLNVITFGLVMALVVGITQSVFDRPEALSGEGKVLTIAPKGLVVDQAVYADELEFPFDFSDEGQVQTRDLIRLLRAAADDETLAGVLIDFSNVGFTGPSTALAVAEELGRLRDSGKPIIAYSRSLSTGSYMMAAQADEIYVHPAGAVSISGLGGYRDYTRELTDKLRINIHNYSQGQYKSATEGLTRNNMSEADREQRTAMLDPIWAAMKGKMAAARDVDSSVIQTMADDYSVPLLDEAGYNNLEMAESLGLIDGTMNFPEFREHMMERFGEVTKDNRQTYPTISYSEYMQTIEQEKEDASESVAVVFVQGGIQEGPQGPGIAGADDIASLLRKAYSKEETKAIVLRVNSPGGSIIASEMIRDEVSAAQRKGIPVVVSMGDVAASGGVWVSMSADKIFAEPTTISGSIGVAVAFPTFERVTEWAGITFDGVVTAEHADWSPVLPMSDKLDGLFARWASTAYDRFVNLVAEGRNKEADYIRSIAGGRVWIGTAAQELGLVDELGDFEDAIASAAELAQLSSYSVDYVTKSPSEWVAILQELQKGLSFTVASPVVVYGDYAARILGVLEDVSEPKATVLCSECFVEL